MAEEKTERWAVSDEEIERFDTLKGDDELLCTVTLTDEESIPTGEAYQVVVLRNGTVTNRNWDGTIGVPEAIRDLAASEEILYHPAADGTLKETSRWVEVAVGPDSEFLDVAEAPKP